MAGSKHLIWLLFLCSVFTSAVCDTFYIISAPGDSCPSVGQCYTLQQYADNPIIRSDINFLELQPGNHSLNTRLTVMPSNSVTNFSMTSVCGTVICSYPPTRGYITIDGVQNVYIGQMSFIDCYSNRIGTADNFIAEDSTFHSGGSTGLVLDGISNALIQRCSLSGVFHHQRNGFLYLRLTIGIIIREYAVSN